MAHDAYGNQAPDRSWTMSATVYAPAPAVVTKLVMSHTAWRITGSPRPPPDAS